MLLLSKELKGYRQRPDHRCKVTITSYRARLITDCVNFHGGCKELVDAIVRVGLLHDDADEWCEVEYSQVKCKKAEERTEIVVAAI